MNTPTNNPYFGSRLLRLTTPNQKGADVRILQALLNMLAGVVFRDRLVEDGIFGPITRNAVRDFQRYFGLTVDGVVGQETYYRLGHRIGKYAVGEPVFSSRTLQNGARGEDVRVLQNRLSAFKKGYLNRPSDGRYMYFTQEAVLMFQLDFPNLEPDSIVKADTYEKIFIHAPLGGRNLRLNLHGLDTYWLQYYLYQLNFYNRQPNGFFDQATATAVSSFQRSADITVDGIVGPQTYLALGTSIAFPQKEYYYRIMIGDSVFKIAQLFGKDIEEIIRLNKITPPNYTIFPGQLLKIPLPLNFHLAQKDETLESVASLYSLTADKLAQANNMVPTSSLLPDETIVLPNYNRALQGKVVFLKQTDSLDELKELNLTTGQDRVLNEIPDLSTKKLFLSKNRDSVAFFTQGGKQIKIYNLETGASRTLSIPITADYMDWSYDGQKLVVNNGLVIDANTGNIIFSFEGQTPQWFTDNESLLYLADDLTLINKINITTGTSETLFKAEEPLWFFQFAAPINKVLFMGFVSPGRVTFTYLLDLNSGKIEEISRNDFFAEWSKNNSSFLLKTRNYFGEFFPWFYFNVSRFTDTGTLVGSELYSKVVELNNDNFFDDLAFLLIMHNPDTFYPIPVQARDLYVKHVNTRLLTQLSSGELLYNPVWR